MGESENVLISIIMPLRNNEKYFPAAVQSIYDQKFQNWELIILEGLSTDNTAEIADDIAAKDDRIRVIHCGDWIYEKINIGVSISKGRYFTVLNSDDKYADGALDLISDNLIKYDPDVFLMAVGILQCDMDQNVLDDNSEMIEGRLPRKLYLSSYEEMKDNWTLLFEAGLFDNQANVYKKECVADFRFRNDVYGGDFLYNISILPCIHSAVYIPKCTYRYHEYEDKSSMNVSLGKYYDYTHSMCNESYFRMMDLFLNNSNMSSEAFSYIKKKRFKEFYYEELSMYLRDSCPLSLEEKLTHILADVADVQSILKITDEPTLMSLEERILTICKAIIDSSAGEDPGKIKNVAEGIGVLFSIGNAPIADSKIEIIEQMVFDYYNPMHIGYRFLSKIKTAIGVL